VAHQPHTQRTSTPVGLSQEARSASLRLFFGGSFDPPHLGHSSLAIQIAHALDPNAQVIYVPAARSPFKPAAPIADHHRINMLRIALDGIPRCEIWEQELDDAPLNEGAPSYWSDTWAIVRAKKMVGMDRFLIGSDQALAMHRWHRYRAFWEDAIVMLRDGEDSVDALIDRLGALGVWSPRDIEHWRSRVVVASTIDASSSAIRDALADSTWRTEPIEGLDPRVQAYIIEHGLYRGA